MLLLLLKKSTLFCGIVGSLVLEQYGWRATFQLIGILTLCWVYYFRNCLSRSQMKANILNMKHESLNDDEPSSTSKHDSSSVPWRELLTKPSFWSLIVAHVCQNNAYYILLTWSPTYFKESYPGSRGWIFNVVPWLISMPSTIFAGWMADKLIAASKNDISFPFFLLKQLETKTTKI